MTGSGLIGGEALAPLVSHYERFGERTRAAARIAWAMAHIGVRGDKAAISEMATGQSVVPPLAAKPLDLLALAAGDHVRKPPDSAASGAERDLTVNHAFSQQFFEALDQGRGAGGHRAGLDGSGRTVSPAYSGRATFRLVCRPRSDHQVLRDAVIGRAPTPPSSGIIL